MPFNYDSEKLQFIDNLEEALKHLATSEYLRNYRNSKQLHVKTSTLFDELGIFEYAKDESCKFTDLILIARVCGRKLICSSYIFKAYIDGYVSRIHKLELGSDCSLAWLIDDAPYFINSQNCSTALGISENFLTLIGDKNADSLKLYEVLNLKVHDSIDLSEPSFTTNEFFEKLSVPTEVLSEIACLISAEVIGLCEQMLSITKSYLMTRKQYGQILSKFQSIQHKLSESYLLCEAGWSLVECAADGVDQRSSNAGFSSVAALQYILEHGVDIIENMLQLHGGIGFTWEYDLHLYLRRAKKLKCLIRSQQEEYIHTLSLVT